MPRLDDLKAKAAAALAHPQLRAFAAAVPPEDRENPAQILGWLMAAQQLDERGARTEVVREAHEALRLLAAMQQLENRAASLYHDPQVRELAGDRLDEFFEHPDRALAALQDLQRNDPDAYWGEAAQSALSLIGEAGSMAAAEDAEPAPADDPDLADDGARDPDEQERYLEAKAEASPETESVHPRDDDTPHLATPGPVI